VVPQGFEDQGSPHTVSWVAQVAGALLCVRSYLQALQAASFVPAAVARSAHPLAFVPIFSPPNPTTHAHNHPPFLGALPLTALTPLLPALCKAGPCLPAAACSEFGGCLLCWPVGHAHPGPGGPQPQAARAQVLPRAHALHGCTVGPTAAPRHRCACAWSWGHRALLPALGLMHAHAVHACWRQLSHGCQCPCRRRGCPEPDGKYCGVARSGNCGGAGAGWCSSVSGWQPRRCAPPHRRGSDGTQAEHAVSCCLAMADPAGCWAGGGQEAEARGHALQGESGRAGRRAASERRGQGGVF